MARKIQKKLSSVKTDREKQEERRHQPAIPVPDLDAHREDDFSDGADDGSGWILSYGDMVTLLLLFFVMMFSVSKPDEQRLEEMKEAIARGKKAITEKMAEKKETEIAEKFSQEEIAGISVHELIEVANSSNSTSEKQEAVDVIEILLGRVVKDNDMDRTELNKKLVNLKKQREKAEPEGLVDSEPTHTYEMVFPASQVFDGDSFDLSKSGEKIIGTLARRMSRSGLINIETV